LISTLNLRYFLSSSGEGLPVLTVVSVLFVILLLTLFEVRAGDRLSVGRLINGGVWGLKIAASIALMPLVILIVPVSVVHAEKLPWGIGFALFFLVMDLSEYLFHRAQHAIPWLWKLHALHHSDPDMNATTTERHFWGDALIKALTIRPAAALLVHPSTGMLFVYVLCSLWNYVAHSRLRISFGRFSWALNSPAYHRRHHSALPEHHNSNFAALLPIWDVLLSSYCVPSKELLPTGLGSNPPTVAEVLLWPLSVRRAPGATA
jgi:sterol desaturase/sphingolipid hydroxylase (fatty acid hydroxylase superfamily)